MLWSQRLNPPLVSHKPLISKHFQYLSWYFTLPGLLPHQYTIPPHPIPPHFLRLHHCLRCFWCGPHAQSDPRSRPVAPEAANCLVKMGDFVQVKAVRMELQPVDLKNDETTEIYPSQKKKVDWAYKRWRFQQTWSNHETGVELTNMELLVKWSQLYHSETVEMKRKHISYINQDLSESTVDHHHHHHHHHHMIVPSNAGIFTIFRQFCKMDWAWEKQDHPKHQPGILSSFYMCFTTWKINNIGSTLWKPNSLQTGTSPC